MSNSYIRLATFALEEVLPFVSVGKNPDHGEPTGKGRPCRVYAGKEVHMDSMRYQTFVANGITCVMCGLKGEFFALETHHNAQHDRFHLNLYGKKDGADILFTKDHILPKGRGGKDTLSNFQTMCAPCNNLKGNFISACGVAADPITVKNRKHAKNMADLGKLQGRINDKLNQIRENGAKLNQPDAPGGGPDFIAYHRKFHARKQLLKARLKKIDELRKVLIERHTQSTMGEKEKAQ